MKVVVKHKNFERAIRLFKRKTVEEGIIHEVKERGYYEKPSDRRRRKRNSAIHRAKRSNK